jgi:hypothetical protein
VSRVALAQRQPLCDEHANGFLNAFDTSHRRSSSGLVLRGQG